ncbi:MAG: sensor histidine kinase [Anaerolineaceae bacterium]
MRNSLIFKLLGAFLLVIAIGSLIISILTSQATRNAFDLYTTRNSQVWAQRMAPVLADYYIQNGNWQGVDVILQSDISEQVAPGGVGNMMGQGQGRGAGRQASGNAMTSSDQRLILADGKGIVISDTLNELIGNQLSTSELQNGVPITVKDSMVGTLIITINSLNGSSTLSDEFLASVNRAIVESVVVVSILALILGAILFIQITAPLRQLSKAAISIANGDLSKRVNIRSKDEIGELGSTFNSMAESLSNAEKQRQHLVADVAHELRTPLTAIQGTLEGIQDGILPMDEEQIAALHSETTLLNRLVGDLRLLSLAEAGQLKLELQETDLTALIQNIAERMKSQSIQKHINLETELQPNFPEGQLDPDRFTQVLTNLIGNALRYTPEDGTIKVQASYLAANDLFQISVEDTGPGIDAENLPYVFDRFYRADKSRTRSSGGSGLGLAIVKQLVEAHGGKIQAESPVFQDENNQGFGTKFSFTLPRHSR